MGSISKIITELRLPITVSVPAYLMDHRFDGVTVMPAVEAMQILAASVRTVFPDIRVRTIRNAIFEKFLYIEPGSRMFSAFCDLTRYENGEVAARLQTKFRSGRSAITRLKEHASLCFSAQRAQGGAGVSPMQPDPGELTIAPERIYRELVPFGLSYHNIAEPITLFRSGVRAVVRAAELAGNGVLPELLGSPFPLDAAFHAACVWGQRFGGMVAFPVGFECREIVLPTRPGGLYHAVVTPLPPQGAGILTFDLRIETLSGECCEAVWGVRMRDVSSGQIKPPAWITISHEGNHESVFSQ
ncbi:MAG: hypothetical protein ACOZF0_16420 [Thermodesulfobacteriota bacterium]